MEARILRSQEWGKVITPELILEMQQKTNQEKQQNTSQRDEKVAENEKKSQSKYEETQSMLQNLLNDTDGSYAKNLWRKTQGKLPVSVKTTYSNNGNWLSVKTEIYSNKRSSSGVFPAPYNF